MLHEAIQRLKGWTLWAAICVVVIPPMEAAVRTLVGGFSHSLLVMTLVIGAGAIIVAILAAWLDAVWLKISSIALVICFALFLGYAALFGYHPSSALTQATTYIKQGNAITYSPPIIGSGNTVNINPAPSASPSRGSLPDPNILFKEKTRPISHDNAWLHAHCADVVI